ncbi:unnamed protein product [Medioppia subpectinata]|uniref:Uncharacterized protein n=1 Tax=Medioppia subpectinata TaxID=1979941 RepID=A0A7R9KCH8_9ACAR|nr:unnamed protein product [Medioppia subpectinata]CAG2100954.1 unnamed protein product [Medioppia subpectinata]
MVIIVKRQYGSAMYSLQQSVDFYNFESDDNYKKWKKTFLTSLELIQQRVHSGLTAKQDALLYVEGLIDSDNSVN